MADRSRSGPHSWKQRPWSLAHSRPSGLEAHCMNRSEAAPEPSRSHCTEAVIRRECSVRRVRVNPVPCVRVLPRPRCASLNIRTVA